MNLEGHRNSVKAARKQVFVGHMGANVVTTFMIGGRPNGIAFDGQNMWVVGGPANSVSKIRANDGSLQGTFPVGNLPGYATF